MLQFSASDIKIYFQYSKYFDGMSGLTNKLKFHILNLFLRLKSSKELTSLYKLGRFPQRRGVLHDVVSNAQSPGFNFHYRISKIS